MYKNIEGYITAEEAADMLVFHANNMANSIKNNDNCFFEFRRSSIQAVMKLLDQYVQQDRYDAAERDIVKPEKP